MDRIFGTHRWRLPTVEELMSLVDRTQFPTLPASNPFDVGGLLVWSATTVAVDTSFARAVDFFNGQGEEKAHCDRSVAYA